MSAASPSGQVPGPADRGRLSADPPLLAADTLTAWDRLIGMVEGRPSLDPDARARRHSVRDTLAVLGEWPESRSLARLRADAASGHLAVPSRDEIDARVCRAHATASLTELIDAVRRNRDSLAAWFDSTAFPHEAHALVGGPLGVVPLGTLAGATGFQVAVAAADLGLSADDDLAQIGLASLLDSAGAVMMAHIDGPDELALTVRTPGLALTVNASADGWRLNSGGDGAGPTLSGAAATVIDIAAGRQAAPMAYARGQIRAQDLPGLLRVAKALAAAADLPGGDGLRAAISAYERVGGWLGRLPGRR